MERNKNEALEVYTSALCALPPAQATDQPQTTRQLDTACERGSLCKCPRRPAPSHLPAPEASHLEATRISGSSGNPNHGPSGAALGKKQWITSRRAYRGETQVESGNGRQSCSKSVEKWRNPSNGMVETGQMWPKLTKLGRNGGTFNTTSATQ